MEASQDDAVTDDAKDDEQGVEDRLQAKNKQHQITGMCVYGDTIAFRNTAQNSHSHFVAVILLPKGT